MLMMKFIKKYYPFILIIVVIFLSHLQTLVNNNGIMIFFGDSYEQQLQFYLGGWERLRNLDFSLWDWSLGYGANYFSHVFYFATSPFFLVTLFFDKAIIPNLFIILNSIKLFLIFVFSYLWLGKISKDRISITIGSLILTFSGWVIFFYHYNHFLDAFLLYPLILFGIEEYINDNRIMTYTISLALLGIINYYFLYMFVLFIFLYTLFRYFSINKSFNYHHFIKSFVTVFMFSVIGIGLSCFILIPSIINIINVPRIQSIEEISIFSIIKPLEIFRYISTLFSPVISRFEPTPYISIYSDPGIGWSGGVSLYSSILFPFAFSQIFFLKDKREKYLIIKFYLLLLFLATFTFSYKLLQGSLDVRWFYMFILLNTYTIVQSLSKLEFDHIKKIITSVTIICFINILIFIISYFNQLYFSSANLKYAILILILNLIFNLTIPILIKFSNFKKIILLVVVVESIITFQLPLWQDPPIKKDKFNEFLEPSLNQSALDYIKSKDKGFYRIIFDNYEYTSQNDPFARYYKGISFYESIYNFEQESFLNRFKSTWSMPVNYGRTNTNIITSVKYFITEEENHLPPYGFDFLIAIDNQKIYVNRFFIELGFTLDDTLSLEEFSKLSYLNQDRLFLSYIITEDSENIKFEYLDSLVQYGEWVYTDRFYLELDNRNDSLVYVENIDIPSFSVNYIKNGEFYKEEKFWQYQYFSIYLDKDMNFNALEIFKDNVYNSPNGYNIYVSSDLDYYASWYEKVKLNSFYNVTVHKDSIEGFINVSNKKTLATSIPYDKGWSVFVDGKEIDYKKVNLGFIGFEIDKGEHKIEFKFFPVGLKIGLIISLLSLVIFITLILINRHNPSKKSR